MSSSKKSRIRLRSVTGPAEFRVFDHRNNTVAHGFGDLDKTLPQGLYILEMTAGPVTKREMIKLLPDKPYERLEIELPFPTPTPIVGTSTSHEYHCGPAAFLSMTPTAQFGIGGRLVLFMRNWVSGSQIEQEVATRHIKLLDHNLEPAGNLTEAWEGEPEKAWCGFSVNLNPGGYVLRFPKRHNWQKSSRDFSEHVDQAVWISPGWTTMFFMPVEKLSGLPANELASTHMVAYGMGFDPYFEEARRVNLALELALTGLRQGKAAISKDFLNLLLYGKFINPMLGVVGAHAMLQERKIKWSLFDTVVKNLQKLIQGSPDVIALQMLGKNLRNDDSKSKVPPVAWPPMLLAGIKGLVGRDAKEPGLIAPASLAEKCAARLYQKGPWTCWEPVSAQELRDARGQVQIEPFDVKPYLVFMRDLWESEKIRDSAEKTKTLVSKLESLDLNQFRDRVENSVTSEVMKHLPLTKSRKYARRQDALQTLWKEISKEKLPQLSEAIRSPEVAAVGDFLNSMLKEARREKGAIDLSKLKIEDISLQMELPVASVQRAIKTIAGNFGDAWKKGNI